MEIIEYIDAPAGSGQNMRYNQRSTVYDAKGETVLVVSPQEIYQSDRRWDEDTVSYNGIKKIHGDVTHDVICEIMSFYFSFQSTNHPCLLPTLLSIKLLFSQTNQRST